MLMKKVNSMTTENEKSSALCNNRTITNIKEAAIQLYYYDNLDIVKMKISYPYPYPHPHPQYDIMMKRTTNKTNIVGSLFDS
jgi:hypothetical protein